MDKRQIVGPAQQRRRYHLITAQEETDPLRFHQHQHQHQQQQEMPRLGGDEDGPRREAEAYANLNRPSNPFNLRTIVMILAVTFILRNLMFTVSCVLYNKTDSLDFETRRMNESINYPTHTCARARRFIHFISPTRHVGLSRQGDYFTTSKRQVAR